MKQLKSDFDRISDLPDSLRCHILSFLPTKDAVATSFVSTKWRNLWTTIPNINLSDSRSLADIKFVTFVNRVLLFHNAPSINKFSLNCHRDDGIYDPHAWVTWAILKHVRVLDVTFELWSDFKFPLPVSLFTCQLLEVLKLMGNISIEVLTKLCLPNLRRMELIEISYYQNDESVSNLISSCPSLQSLRISRMGHDGVDTIRISSSTLKSLCVERSAHLWSGFEHLKYVINAPDLTYLDIVSGTVTNFLIENSTSFGVVDIRDTEYDEYIDDEVDVNIEYPRFLHGICCAHTLRLGVEIFQSSISANLFPKFDRLTVLEAKAYCCHWSLLQAFISNSEKLQCLSFTKYPCEHDSEEEHDAGEKYVICWRIPESVPKCLSTSLTKVSFIDFDGFEDELAMAEYILQNGQVMQKMEIEIRSSLDDKLKVQFLQKLLKFHRASVGCEVTIS